MTCSKNRPTLASPRWSRSAQNDTKGTDMWHWALMWTKQHFLWSPGLSRSLSWLHMTIVITLAAFSLPFYLKYISIICSSWTFFKSLPVSISWQPQQYMLVVVCIHVSCRLSASTKLTFFTHFSQITHTFTLSNFYSYKVPLV
jgi:hypothetical protein